MKELWVKMKSNWKNNFITEGLWKLQINRSGIAQTH